MCDDRAMPDQDDPADAADATGPEAGPETESETGADGPVFSPYGIASTVLALVSVAAVVLGWLIFAAHRDETGERVHLTLVMQAAAEWTGVLINMNTSPISIDAKPIRSHMDFLVMRYTIPATKAVA